MRSRYLDEEYERDKEKKFKKPSTKKVKQKKRGKVISRARNEMKQISKNIQNANDWFLGKK